VFSSQFLIISRIQLYLLFLGEFVRWRKAPVTFVIPACLCLSVRMYQRGNHRTNLLLISYWGLLQKSVGETPNLVKIGQKYRKLYMKT
jgi:hypothetical protein